MRRWLPLPRTSAMLFAGWLLLAGVSAGQVLLAAGFALALPPFARRFVEEPLGHARGRRAALAAARFALLVTWDIVLANVAVARLVLGRSARLRPVYVEVPLELERPLAIALLASVITMTPGTVSSDLSHDRRRLRVHVLHAEEDPQALVERIKQRYERPLLEIFA
jgi:multicomponent K+:H+ antiporter subunit E